MRKGRYTKYQRDGSVIGKLLTFGVAKSASESKGGGGADIYDINVVVIFSA